VLTSGARAQIKCRSLRPGHFASWSVSDAPVCHHIIQKSSNYCICACCFLGQEFYGHYRVRDGGIPVWAFHTDLIEFHGRRDCA
jgi:hypothetical protein